MDHNSRKMEANNGLKLSRKSYATVIMGLSRRKKVKKQYSAEPGEHRSIRERMENIPIAELTKENVQNEQFPLKTCEHIKWHTQKVQILLCTEVSRHPVFAQS